ncbi:universal stress protein, partial [Enterococcus sp.]
MDAQRYQNILVGIDGSEQAKDAFKKAVEVARRNQGKVYAATIIDQQMP